MKQIFSNFSNLIALFTQNTKEQTGGQITSVPDLTSQILIRTQLLFSRPDLKNLFFGVFEAKYLWKYLSYQIMIFIIRIVSSWPIFLGNK